MHILIIGAAGMVGAKLIGAARQGRDARRQGHRRADAGRRGRADAARRRGLQGRDGGGRPVHRRARPSALPPCAPDVIFHLAAIVSGEAEADFEKGYRVNLDGTRYLFEAIRKVGDGYKPRLVFTSSIAVFGAPFPEAIGDEFFHTPLTSYGTQKAIDELLLSDYTRRGFIDGIGIRLPTICVRPGKPNKAASGFFSNIIREPLAGHEAVLPVPETRAPLACEPALGGQLPRPCRRRSTAPPSARGATSPCPASSVTVGEQIEALRKVAGDDGRQAHPPRARPDDHAASSRAGRAISRPSARRRSASGRSRASRRSSASTSRTSSAAPG